MKHIILARFFSDKNKTLGNLILHDERYKELARMVTLELPDNDNKKNISCIPARKYEGIAIIRPNGRYAIHIQDVPNRNAILIHSGNYTTDIQGCILPGSKHVDINNDGILDVDDSKKSMEILEKHIPVGEKCKITIIDAYRSVGNLDPKTAKTI
jgi:hypothetical protein